MVGIFDDFTERNEMSLHDILINLLDNKNIEMKTDISNPSAIAVLKIIAVHYKKRGLKIPYSILNVWVIKFLELMVSYNRLSRKEIIQALQIINEYNREVKPTMRDKLVGTIA